MSVQPPKDVCEVKPFINALIYSDPGVGKTTLAATAQAHPGMRDCLVLNFEGGTLSIAGVKGVKVVDIHSIEDLEEVFWLLVNKKEGYDHYQTVIIDSGSEMQTLDLEHTARSGFEKERKQNKTTRESIDELFQADYGSSTMRLKRIFRWYRDAPFNLIVTALVRRVYKKKAQKDAEPELLAVVPAFTDKLSQAVMGYCDFVWYLFQERVEENGQVHTVRRLLTQERGMFKAKTRGQQFSKLIGECVTNPDLADLYTKLVQSENIKLP